MMNRINRWSLYIIIIYLLQPARAYADFWGGDLPLLTQIVVNTIQELVKLEGIIGKGQETIDLINDINHGVRDAMNIIRTRNETLSPGVLSDLRNVQQIMSVVENLYGRVPKTQNSQLEQTTDTTVAESIQLHNDAFKYADQVDPEAERIKDYARDVNPLGAQKLTAQGVGVLIHVMNQLLRTNAAILKLQSEQLALQNRGNKLESEQFKVQYDELSDAFQNLKPAFHLNSFSK
jgi:hypothetical protein